MSLPNDFISNLSNKQTKNPNQIPEFPSVAQESRTRFYRLIGVFWLRAGNDRLDVVSIGDSDAQLRGILRGGAGLHTLDDHGGTVLSRSEARRHVYCRAGQLDGEFSGGNRISEYEGEFFQQNFKSFIVEFVIISLVISNIIQFDTHLFLHFEKI